MERFRDRFDGSYAASTEARELLERADLMNDYIRNNPSMDGANEWDVLGASLQELAAAYGTGFPLPDDVNVRRIGDGELEDAGAAISDFAADLRKTVRKETRGMDELDTSAESLEDELASMSKVSSALSKRIRSGKPASAEARQLMDSVEKAESLIRTPGMPPAVDSAWQAGESSIDKVVQAFQL